VSRASWQAQREACEAFIASQRQEGLDDAIRFWISYSHTRVGAVIPAVTGEHHHHADIHSLREKLYGQGRARLGADYPAVRYRSIADPPGN
jgi:hypothetical protein